MLTLPNSLQTKLDARATTVCHCWRLQRIDGAVMGFTDHDRDLVFNGVTFRANTGLTASQVEGGVGLAPATGEAGGALSADSLLETDLVNGLYDGATVETWFVDWSNVSDRVLLDVGAIGEVRRAEHAFNAEIRSSAHRFDQQQGRAYQRNCAADLGDARCGVNLASPAFYTVGVVVAAESDTITADLAQPFDSGFFTSGVLTFTSGANADARLSVKSHRQQGARTTIVLWASPAGVVAVGDTLRVTAGCDKSPGACQSKFANIVNFRGFPHMPGNDRVIAYPSALAPKMDGKSFFK